MTVELDALDPEATVVTLSTGTHVKIGRLRARQFFKLLRIVTRGALPNMQDLSLFNVGGDLDAKEFAGRFLSLMLLSIPEAEDEAVEFIQSMVEPVGLIDRRFGTKLNKVDTERNTELWSKVITDTDNPELDDLVTIVEAIVKREAGDIQALGKRLTAMFKMAEKTGQLKPGESQGQTPTDPAGRIDQTVTNLSGTSSRPSPTSPERNSSAASPAPTTFSVTSTGGPTSTATTSHSSGYASVSLPSANAVSTTGGNTNSG